MRQILLAGTTAAALAAAPAAAQSPLVPSGFTLGGSFDTELNLDRIGKRGDRSAYWDFTNKSELGLYLNMPAGFTVNGVLSYVTAAFELLRPIPTSLVMP